MMLDLLIGKGRSYKFIYKETAFAKNSVAVTPQWY